MKAMSSVSDFWLQTGFPTSRADCVQCEVGVQCVWVGGHYFFSCILLSVNGEADTLS